MNNTIKIAHLCHEFPARSETFVYNFITRTPNTTSIVLTNKTPKLPDFPCDNIFTKNRYWQLIDKLYRKCSANTEFPCSYFYKKILKNHPVDLIHAHFGLMGLWGIELKKAFRLPLVTSFYGYDLSVLPKDPYFKKMYPKLFLEGDAFLVEGTVMKQTLINLGCPSKKIYIRHIGIDTAKFQYQERNTSDPIILLMCCRFCEKKGLLDAIKAFQIAQQHYPNLKLRIIGDADEQKIQLKEKLYQFIQQHQLNDKVSLLGWLSVDEYKKESDKAHIFLHPSKTSSTGDTEGGAPTVILEMQACGLPVISTRHADIPEVVRENALLANEGDIEGIAKNILKMIELKNDWKKMGVIGRHHIETHYHLETELQKLHLIYKQILKQI